MFFSAILAFAPVISVDYLMDSYIRMRGMQEIKMSVNGIVEETQKAVESATISLQSLTSRSPSLCTPTFFRAAAVEMRANYLMRQLIVNSTDGALQCALYGDKFSYTAITPTMSMPGGPQEMTVVQIEDNEFPLLKVSLRVRPGKEVSAFVPINAHMFDSGHGAVEKSIMTRFALTSGLTIFEFGDPARFFDDVHRQENFLYTQQVAQNVPIAVSAAIPIDLIASEYADLQIGFTLVASLASCIFLWLCVQYVRRSQAPTFDLERAINDGELRPRYQPVIDLQTGHIAGCEVLIRWEKPNGEVISPGAFIEYAELSGLAIPMTLSMMEQVRDDLEDLCDRHPHLKVGINLFERHFRDGSIVEDVQSIFGATNIRYSQLVFEITERQPLSDMGGVNAVIHALRDLGSKVALDDAGTGHSNLAYIQKLGIDIVKIDRVFVELIKHRNQPVPVVDALISMANDLGTEIIAEGVETEEQALYLRKKGIRQAQGFLFAPALPVDAYLALAERMNNEEVQLIDELDSDRVNDLVGFVDDEHAEIGVDYGGQAPGVDGSAQIDATEATGTDSDQVYVAPETEIEDEPMIGDEDLSDKNKDEAVA
ncbi:EAL domain-containing protein [Maritalea porphyrae]|uniref:EAL domain-containing protein n=1 Tax=Maritalea porphyrae TaxID=880732 RepID=UPI0022AE7248|nr:EAL domain-containing protein [Maritalea porphyrae]MCZ4272943.1 EAL domain-containing protein [Maritalea porphyrae]